MSGDKKARTGLSGEQIQMVIERYSTEDSSALAKLIGITPDYLRALASRFGLSKSAEQMAAIISRRGKGHRKGSWNHWEDIYLKSAWAGTELSEISRVLPSRTISAICQRAHKLGFKRGVGFRKKLNISTMLAEVEAPQKPEDVVVTSLYGEKVGHIKQYLIKNRPASFEVREIKPSARNYASGSLLGMAV